MENPTEPVAEPVIKIQFRVSVEENQLLRSRANQAGLSLSEFLRRAGLGVPIEPRLPASVWDNLSKIGGNLNQALHWSNTNKYLSNEIEELVLKLKDILKRTK